MTTLKLRAPIHNRDSVAQTISLKDLTLMIFWKFVWKVVVNTKNTNNFQYLTGQFLDLGINKAVG